MTRVGTSQLAAGCRTDAGRLRTNNEDLFVCDPERGIFAVIDGVGGQSAGEVAAAIARRVMLDRLARPLGTPGERVREAIALANNEIFRAAEASAEYHGMTCVLTLALVVDHHITIGHVGDSRLYKLSPRGIRKLTHDHSPVGAREDAHELTELEAMGHPRRNEVFRDVGSVHRDKDEERFVEIVEDTIEDDSAILMCTDGLTDLVPSSTIAHLVREHAGDPQAVAEALVFAANEAGGTDNVTTLFAEAPEFARAVRRAWTVLPRVTVEPPPQAPMPPATLRTATARAADVWQRMIDRRAALLTGLTGLAVGTLVGVGSGLLLAWRVGAAPGPAPRTLAVGRGDGRAFTRIADSVASARAGDVIELEPGTYAEQVVLPAGVDLVSRVPGKAKLIRAENVTGDWTALTATGAGRIRGIRIASTSNAPVTVAIRVSGADRRIELVDMDGPMRTAVDLESAAGVTVTGCFIRTADGPAVVVNAATDVTLANNTFIRAGGRPAPAVVVNSVNGDAWPILDRNVFGGYGVEIVKITGGTSSSTTAQLLSGNFVVASEPAAVR